MDTPSDARPDWYKMIYSAGETFDLYCRIKLSLHLPSFHLHDSFDMDDTLACNYSMMSKVG